MYLVKFTLGDQYFETIAVLFSISFYDVPSNNRRKTYLSNVLICLYAVKLILNENYAFYDKTISQTK